jgi:hypothetical protein
VRSSSPKSFKTAKLQNFDGRGCVFVSRLPGQFFQSCSQCDVSLRLLRPDVVFSLFSKHHSFFAVLSVIVHPNDSVSN